MSILTLKNICFNYPGTQRKVLRDLSIDIQKNQKIGLIGANGQGKTTLLHICLGLLRPCTGNIFYKDQPVDRETTWREIRRSLGLVFQNPEDQLFCPTVLEDVAFGPLNLGARPEQARTTAMKVLKQVGLAGYEKRITHKLSGGEKKLLSIATILAMEPDFIFFDEPTSGLDPDTRANLIQLIQGLKQGFLIVSHDWDFLYHTTEELISMEQGKIVKLKRSILHQHVHLHPSGGIPHEHANGHLLPPAS